MIIYRCHYQHINIHFKYLLLFMICLIIHKSYLYLDDSLLITTLDVGQGDSIFIKFPNNKENILIDTGGKINLEKETWKKSKKEFSIAEKNIIYSYLYLIL